MVMIPTEDSEVDGGYAWLILAAGLILTCFEHIPTNGIFYMAILEKYQRDHYATIWIQTLQTAMSHLAGFIGGVLIEKKSCRLTALVGGITYTLSIFASSFAGSLEVLYLSLGIVPGFSQALLNTAVFTIIPQYFEKKLGMAIGLTKAGKGFGLLVFSALNGYLIEIYGLQGTLLILSGIAAHTISLGMLMRRPAPRREMDWNIMNMHDKKAERQCLLTGDKEESFLPDAIDDKLQVSTPVGKTVKTEHSVKNTEAGKENRQMGCNISSLLYTVGLDLFTNKYFTLLTLAASLITIPHNVVPTVMPDNIKMMGGTTVQATSSLVIIGIANTVSRLFVWNFSKDDVLHSVNILAISSFLSGIGLVCTIFLQEYWMYVILCVLFGLTRGVYIIYYYILLLQLIEQERRHHAYGIAMTTAGIILVIAMSSFGALTDATYKVWGYNVVFIINGSCEIAAGCILIVIRILHQSSSNRREDGN